MSYVKKPKPYIVYCIQTDSKVNDLHKDLPFQRDHTYVVERRYSEFEALHLFLKSRPELHGITIPALPAK